MLLYAIISTIEDWRTKDEGVLKRPFAPLRLCRTRPIDRPTILYDKWSVFEQSAVDMRSRSCSFSSGANPFWKWKADQWVRSGKGAKAQRVVLKPFFQATSMSKAPLFSSVQIFLKNN